MPLLKGVVANPNPLLNFCLYESDFGVLNHLKRRLINMNSTICANNVKDKSESKRFTGNGFWIVTDSKFAERIWNKGGSTDKELYDIMLDMQEISLEH